MNALHRPESPAALFRACNRLSLMGFGGVLPIAQAELVERRQWLSKAQFLEMLSLAQVLPGPNIVNLVLMYGDRCFGWRGAMAALAGVLLVPLLLVLLLAFLYSQVALHPMVAGALRGMGAVAAGLVFATAVKLSFALRGHPLGALPCALFAGATLVLVGVLRWPLAGVVLALGGLAVAAAGWRLRRRS